MSFTHSKKACLSHTPKKVSMPVVSERSYFTFLQAGDFAGRDDKGTCATLRSSQLTMTDSGQDRKRWDPKIKLFLFF